MRASRVDGNHREIVATFQTEGCSVLSLAKLGKGAPDLLVSPPGRRHVFLVEIKNPATFYGRRGLNPLQAAFAEMFPVHVVTTPEEARSLTRAAAPPRIGAA